MSMAKKVFTLCRENAEPTLESLNNTNNKRQHVRVIDMNRT